MDYGLLPPEINSGRMYAGPGSDSLVAAAAAWAALADNLYSVAAAYRSEIADLISVTWQGPSGAALAAAAAPYGEWLQSSAGQADLAASQASAAAAAHKQAFAMTVPPPAIVANRTLLNSLVATNFLGQHTPAIAAAEAEYFQMWAQDAAAMYAYAAASAAAADLADFEEPTDVANPAGLAGQTTAVASAVIHSAPVGAQNLLAQLKGLSNPLSMLNGATFGNFKPIDNFLITYTPFDDLASIYTKYLGGYVSTAAMGVQTSQSFGQVSNGVTAMTSFMKGLAPAAAAAVPPGGQALSGLGGLGSGGGGVGAAAKAISAELGHAIPMGGLSVPPSWPSPVHAVTNPLGAGGAIPAGADGVNTLPVAPLGGLSGKASWRVTPTYGFKPAVMAKPPAAG